MRCSEHYRNVVRDKLRKSPPMFEIITNNKVNVQNIGHKSNSLLILRDYIVSAASQINAGGGSNGFNPTNLGMSDFSLVATTLDTNNAYKFMSGIEGMDRFGK